MIGRQEVDLLDTRRGHEEDVLTVKDITSSCQEEGVGGREGSMNVTEVEPSIDSKTHCNSSATGKHTCIPSINLSGTSEDTPPPPVPDTSHEDRTDGHHYQGVGVQVVSEDGPGPARSDRRRRSK